MANIEVVYIPNDQQIKRVYVTFVDGMTVKDVVEQSGLFDSHPELINAPVGIFSRAVELGDLVKLGDRVEFYRALTLNPMETRRRRAKK